MTTYIRQELILPEVKNVVECAMDVMRDHWTSSEIDIDCIIANAKAILKATEFLQEFNEHYAELYYGEYYAELYNKTKGDD